MASPPDEIAARLAAVRARIQAAALAAGRAPEAIRLVAVSKLQPEGAIRAAYRAGQRDFGENYAQELATKAAALRDLPELRWHFIGSLQRNKAKLIVGETALVHTLDGVPLADELERRGERAGVARIEALIEVNVGGESHKSGVAPADVGALLDALGGRPRLRIRGLMAIPPASDDPEATRPHFRALAELARALASRPREGVSLGELSMGMSADVEVAIQEGATIVRVGTAIFGDRPARH